MLVHAVLACIGVSINMITMGMAQRLGGVCGKSAILKGKIFDHFVLQRVFTDTNMSECIY